MKSKNIVRTYRNGKSVFLLELKIDLRSNIAGTEFYVTETRARHKDEKIVYVGRGKTAEKDAQKVYDDIVPTTIIGGADPIKR